MFVIGLVVFTVICPHVWLEPQWHWHWEWATLAIIISCCFVDLYSERTWGHGKSSVGECWRQKTTVGTPQPTSECWRQMTMMWRENIYSWLIHSWWPHWFNLESMVAIAAKSFSASRQAHHIKRGKLKHSFGPFFVLLFLFVFLLFVLLKRWAGLNLAWLPPHMEQHASLAVRNWRKK